MKYIILKHAVLASECWKSISEDLSFKTFIGEDALGPPVGIPKIYSKAVYNYACNRHKILAHTFKRHRQCFFLM